MGRCTVLLCLKKVNENTSARHEPMTKERILSPEGLRGTASHTKLPLSLFGVVVGRWPKQTKLRGS